MQEGKGYGQQNIETYFSIFHFLRYIFKKIIKCVLVLVCIVFLFYFICVGNYNL